MTHPAPVTADRRTVLALGIPETTVGRREWTFPRDAADIQSNASQKDPAAPKSERVMRVGGGEAWIMAPYGMELAELTDTDHADSVMGAGDANLAPGFEAIDMWRRADDLPGIDPRAGKVARGLTAFLKTVGDAVGWAAAQLFADAAAFPQVPSEAITGQYPLDRVLSGTKTYPARAPFALRWYLPDTFAGTDSFLCFYFGGQTETTPDEACGGHFALSLRGGGTARLFELDDKQVLETEKWRKRMEWQYSDAGGFKNRFEMLYAIPYARNRIEFRSAGVVFDASGGGFTGLLPLIPNLGLSALTLKKPDAATYKDIPAFTGHSHVTEATGPGTVRMDVARDQRVPVSIANLKFPSADKDQNSVLVDAPFAIPWTLDEGTPIKITTRHFLPDNTSIAASLYDADTHELLENDTDGNWLSVLGQTVYYAKFAFGSVDGTQTPVLWGYDIEVESAYRTNDATPNTSALITRVGIQCAATDPNDEQVDLAIRDVSNAVSILRQRDGIRSVLQVWDSNGGSLISNLMECETTSPDSSKRGIPGYSYPSEEWRDVDARLRGMGGRLAETFVLSPMNFAQDKNAEPDPKTQQPPPWKVTDILRKLFNRAGFNDDDLDIPDLPIRLWPVLGALTAEDQALLPGVDFLTVIHRLAWDYLRMVVVRDMNCRTGLYEGKWRLILNPIAPYSNIVGTFHITEPGSIAGKMPHMLESYPVGECYVTRDNFKTHPVKPEANDILILGKNADTGELFMSRAINGPSLGDDQTHPDYIGRHVPAWFPVDPTLNSQEACDWACRIIYDAAAHGQKWANIESPLMFVTDPLDTQQVRPRKLQVNDLISIGGEPAIVRDVRIDYEHDWDQRMAVRALFLTDVAWSAAAASSQQVLRKAVSLIAGKAQGVRPSPLPPIWRNQIMNPQAMPHHLSLPVKGGRTPLQAPDGTFYYMLGYDGLGEAPLN